MCEYAACWDAVILQLSTAFVFAQLLASNEDAISASSFQLEAEIPNAEETVLLWRLLKEIFSVVVENK